LIEAALVANKKIGIVALRRKEAEEVQPERPAPDRVRGDHPEDGEDAGQQPPPLDPGNARLRLGEITSASRLSAQ